MLLLRYDDTYEGFLTAVFEAFSARGDVSVQPASRAAPSFFETRGVETDTAKARRVAEGVSVKLGVPCLETVEAAWLTHDDRVEDDLVGYLRRSFAAGCDVRDDRNDAVVARVARAAVKSVRECEKMIGFVRFRPCGRLYIADIRPTNDILPLMAGHFADRFGGQPFVIRDHTHMRALISGGRRWSIADFDSFDDDGLQNADAFESLWTAYYRAMCIEARRNPKLRRQFMPKKYWRDLPEVRAEC